MITTFEIAEPTENLLLTEILDMDTGQSVDPRSFLSRDLTLVMQARSEMAGRYARDPERPWLVCELCGGATMLVRTKERLFHFRHHPDEEGTRGCPISTRGLYSAAQINRMKYNAAKESQAHLRLKEIIRQSLVADRACGEPQVETVWRGMTASERAAWRKPDVQVSMGDQRLAFEVQLSTTFLTEIAGRREFYRANSGAMIWIFENFDPTQTRTAEEDIFYLNNLNVFVVNDKTLKRSLDHSRMAIECWYAAPRLRGKNVVNEWVQEDIFLDQLHIHPDRQQVFFHDYQARRAELEEWLCKDNLRQTFVSFWTDYGHRDDDASREAWVEIRDRMTSLMPHILLPERHWFSPFHGAVSIVLSARYGYPVGYKLRTLIEVANVAYSSYKAFILPFGWTLSAFDQQLILDDQDKSRKWAQRRAEIRTGLVNQDAAYLQDRQFDRLFAFLVPEITDRLARTT